MKPPICVVCNDRFDALVGALVTCAENEASRAFRVRAEAPGFVGHPPNEGWFCATHQKRAKELCRTLALPDVIAAINDDGTAPHKVTDEAATAGTTEPTLAPDLVGVELGTGVVTKKRFRPGSTIVWPSIDSPMDTMIHTFIDSLPAFTGVLNLDAAPAFTQSAFTHSTRRTWNPMDGAQPPDCPFTDDDDWEWHNDNTTIGLSTSITYWNETSIANRSARMIISIEGQVVLFLTAASHSDAPASLTLQRPTSSKVVSTVRALFDC